MTPPTAPTPAPAPDTLGERLMARLRDGAPLSDLEVLDVHGHLGPWESFWIPEPTASSMVAVMDRVGVDTIAISSMLGIGPDTRTGNEDMATVLDTHAGRFLGHVVANPFRPDERGHLRDLLARPDVVGIKVHPSTHECEIDRPEYDWVIDLAVASDVAVLAHSQAACAYSHPSRFDDVARRHPDARMILAHAGVTPDGFRASVDVLERHPELVVDVCGSHITGDWIRWLVDQVGAQRVLYGSDMPFIDGRYAIGRVVGAGLGDDDLRAVLGGNARRLLHL